MNEFGYIDPIASVTSVLCKHMYEGTRVTAVVCGLAQGGTSVVAAVVDALGFSSNDVGHLYNFETEGRPYPGDEAAEWRRKVTGLNSRQTPYSIKDPGIFRFDPEWVHASIDNPYYLVVAKDVMSTTQRRFQKSPVTYNMLSEVLQHHEEMWRWVNELPPSPLLGISYQRAVANPAAFVDEVSSFLGVVPTPEQRVKAINRVSPTGGYLMSESNE